MEESPENLKFMKIKSSPSYLIIIWLLPHDLYNSLAPTIDFYTIPKDYKVQWSIRSVEPRPPAFDHIEPRSKLLMGSTQAITWRQISILNQQVKCWLCWVKSKSIIYNILSFLNSPELQSSIKFHLCACNNHTKDIHERFFSSKILCYPHIHPVSKSRHFCQTTISYFL